MTGLLRRAGRGSARLFRDGQCIPSTFSFCCALLTRSTTPKLSFCSSERMTSTIFNFPYQRSMLGKKRASFCSGTPSMDLSL
jgi:hypothetical protein